MEYLDILNIILLICVVSLLFLFFVTPRPIEKFSAFYLLNSSGYFGDYPDELPYGYSYPIFLGVINNEYNTTSYSVILNNDSEIIESFELEHNSSVELPYMISINWLGNNKITFSLIKNGDMTNQSLRLWINGSEFFILNESNGIEIRTSIPIYFDLPLNVFIMNPFNVTKTFSLESQYIWIDQNISDYPVTNLGTFELDPMEKMYIPHSIEIDKFYTNPIYFTIKSEDYVNSKKVDITGELFYLLNNTYGYDIPKELPIGTELTVKLGLHYLWYTPGYTPIDLILYHWEGEEIGVENSKLLSQFNLSMEYGDYREFERSQIIKEGNNSFIFEVTTRHFRETIFLDILGV